MPVAQSIVLFRSLLQTHAQGSTPRCTITLCCPEKETHDESAGYKSLEKPGNSHQPAGPGPRYPQACSVVIGSTARSPLPLARGIFNTNRRSLRWPSTAAEAPPDTVHHSRLPPFLTKNRPRETRTLAGQNLRSFLPTGGVRCKEPLGHLPVRSSD
ncbi:hypothetical protein E2C01_059730 [Portunus trituberculatus]|uniref:Uncharacterized protein n=1 Tax=Portunus trituberculatus TaxID=210409 RepID=A0A5B7GZ69_PORTR|nr:hypothetical protein [Portunus trituberculatus]